MSRPSWHWQAGLDVAVDTARHQLDHAVRVEMKLATARARPGHHMPRFRSLGWLAARHPASPAHRSPTSYKARELRASVQLVESTTSRCSAGRNTATGCRCVPATRLLPERLAAVATTSSARSLIGGSRHSSNFVLKSLHFKTLCVTLVCTTPPARDRMGCRVVLGA